MAAPTLKARAHSGPSYTTLLDSTNAQTFSCCSFDNPAMTPTIPYRWWCVDRLNSPSLLLRLAKPRVWFSHVLQGADMS